MVRINAKNVQNFESKIKGQNHNCVSFAGLLKNFNIKKKIMIFLIILFTIIQIFKVNVKINNKICLCVIAKNENLYAREFVEYYKKIGYDKIFIYDNNEINGEYFEEVINDYVKNGFVNIINFRGRNPNSNPQVPAYRDCYQRNNKLFDWLSFFDMDEFLEINKKYNSIKDFLSDKIFEFCDNIKINWLLYAHNNNLNYENISLLKRMNGSSLSKNKRIKSTVRGNLPVNYWINCSNPHTSKLNISSCSSSGKKIKYDSPFNNPPDYINAKLNHYYYKSFEEYCLKIKRGRADHSLDSNHKYINQKLIHR